MGKWSKRERKQLRTGLIVISPWLIGLLSFTVIPLILAFGMSLTIIAFYHRLNLLGWTIISQCSLKIR